MSWEVLFFETNRGESPVEIFITALDDDTQAKVFRMAYSLLQEYGPGLSMPHSRKMAKNLYELRIRGKVEVRIFYAFKANKIYLVHTFRKKTQKTPLRELEVAKNRSKLL